MNLIRKPKNLLFQKEDTYPLRGVAMLMIIFHHIWQVICREDFDPSPFLTRFFFSPAGSLGTGLFFLVSGYGMFISLTHQHSLNFNYLLPRLWKLIKPFISCFILFIVAILIFKRKMFEIGLLSDIFTLTLPTSSTWFLKVIVGIYIGVYFVFKLKIQLTYKVLIVAILCLSYFVIAIHTLPLFWYSSILCYPLGMLIAWKQIDYEKWGGNHICNFMCYDDYNVGVKIFLYCS